MKAPPERLGSFYLGAKYDLASGKILEEPVHYDARDLTTHAICLGMTGSGKTGLCVCLLEEAALDKVPAIIIDPKGDITNLLLQFTNLEPKDFEPWVNVDDARRKGMSIADYAANVAETWRKGLGDWGISPERIAQLKESVEYTIFTPGSEAGVAVNIMGSLASPKLDFSVDGETARDRINGTVAALLDLMDLKLDPNRSPEGILLSNIFDHYWSRNEDLSLEKLITSIQKPPFRKLGVFDLEAFYPAKERFQLAIGINTLIASPSFSGWLMGESLDVDRLLYNAEGKPRHSIFYLAHLSDNERMFFVTLLLENIKTWVRRQQGTTSLRALLYFDEVFGFMPPVAEPSSKKPLMTLLKQARAFGLGVSLVTQNPVDIDYKGLTNTGTWIIGKLQAERDKEKVVEGLKGAIMESGGIGGETDYDTLINRLSSRVFLLHNIHQGPPQVIHSRWAMSYLRGPLTKPQISELMRNRRSAQFIQPAPIHTPRDAEYLSSPPGMDPKISQVYVSDIIVDGFSQTVQTGTRETRMTYEPRLMAKTTIGYYDKRLGIDQKYEQILLLPIRDEVEARWDKAQRFSSNHIKYSNTPAASFMYIQVPEQINTAQKIQTLGRTLTEHLLNNSRLKIISHKELGLTQKEGEDERAFTIRLREAARERRDADVKKLQTDYESKIDKVEDKIRSLERELSSDQDEYQARKREEYVGLGETVLGYFIGRRRSTGITTASRRRRMVEKAGNEVKESQEKLADLKKDINELEDELKEAADKVTRRWETALDDVTTLEVRPSRNEIKIEFLTLAWTPI